MSITFCIQKYNNMLTQEQDSLGTLSLFLARHAAKLVKDLAKQRRLAKALGNSCS
jgi:hypothetical protein